jgi:hypothetical protein
MTSLICSSNASGTVQLLGLLLVDIWNGRTFHFCDLVLVQLDIVIAGILILWITRLEMDSAYTEDHIVPYEPSNN